MMKIEDIQMVDVRKIGDTWYHQMKLRVTDGNKSFTIVRMIYGKEFIEDAETRRSILEERFPA